MGKEVKWRILLFAGVTISAAFVNRQVAGAQQTGAVDGYVIDTKTGKTVQGAVIRLLENSRASESTKTATTDIGGRFAFHDVPAGNYCLDSQTSGFFLATEPCFTISARWMAIHRELRLVPYASISGRIVEPVGDILPGNPPEGAPLYPVELLQRQAKDPEERARRVFYTRRGLIGDEEIVPVAEACTNDRGEYRFEGLKAGTYYVAAQPDRVCDAPVGSGVRLCGGRVPCNIPPQRGYPADKTLRTTYFPHSLHSADAAPIVVGTGEDLQKIDIQFIRKSGVRIAGHVTWESASRIRLADIALTLWPEAVPGETRPVPRLEISAIYKGLGVQPLELSASDKTPGVQFELPEILPGRHVLAVFAYAFSGDYMYEVLGGWQTVDVAAQDLHDIEISLFPPVVVSGEMRFEEGCPVKPVLMTYSGTFQAGPEDGGAAPQADGTFVMRGDRYHGMFPGKYTVGLKRLVDDPPYVYSIASAELDGKGVLSDGLSIGGGTRGSAGPLRVTIGCRKIK